VAALNLLRLAELTLADRYRDNATLLFSAFHDLLGRQPTRLPEMLLALEYFFATTKEVILVRPASGANSEEMLTALRTSYAPNRIVAIVTEGSDLDRHAEIVPLVAGKVARGGRTTGYVCENRVCKFPTTDPAVFAVQLRQETAAE
jgi:uncharacterized protein YyaL (SSP411 family)